MPRTSIAASLVAAWLAAAGLPLPSSPAPASLTIDQLIDIRHPSNPIWSPDSRRIAFTWERAGVANLYVVPADGSSAPAQITKDGVPPGCFWSPDSRSLLFFRGGALMSLPLDGGNRKGPLVEFMTYPGEFHYFTREHVLKDAWTRVDQFFARWLTPARGSTSNSQVPNPILR